MDNPTPQTNLQAELDELLAEVTKDQRAFNAKGKALVERADKLAGELEKTDFSDLDDAEKKAMKDMSAVVAEEMTSIEEDEEDGE